MIFTAEKLRAMAGDRLVEIKREAEEYVQEKIMPTLVHKAKEGKLTHTHTHALQGKDTIFCEKVFVVLKGYGFLVAYADNDDAPYTRIIISW